MQYLKNYSLKEHNTFGVDVLAKEFISVKTITELKTLLQQKTEVFVLGGGSNMLLTKDIDKTVAHINITGVIVNNESKDYVEVTAMAGENWHEFVLWCIDQNYGGIENLSLIPGNVGTCPIQNIGAYGVEVKDTILFVEVINTQTLEIEKIYNKNCGFGYRTSIFKTTHKGEYIILSVTFKLTTQNHHINISYGAIKNELQNQTNPSLKEISNAIINIRNSKLPNPKEIGNGGSFFKNPIVDINLFHQLKSKYANIPSYPVSDTQIKVPAGWLIEKAGFKGKSYGNAGVHHQQALVLVNYGDATGNEIYAVAKKIQEKVKKNFNIVLEIEVNVF
ncbi:UDP-N-acetylmuramate dehydrogenase [Wenyingzhuangia sp. IMCC45533]